MQLFLLNWVKQIKTILSFKRGSLLADSLRCQCDVHKNIKHISSLVCNGRARHVRLLRRPFKATFILFPTFIIHIFYSISFLTLEVTLAIFPDPFHPILIIKTLYGFSRTSKRSIITCKGRFEGFCYATAGIGLGQPHFSKICYSRIA